MPFPPSVARNLASLMLPPEELERLQELHFYDAGHGFDPFGMHPAFVALGEGISSFLYNKYFRVKSYGAEVIPASGSAILAANHSGNIPIDGMMIWNDVVRHTNPPRVVRAVADNFVPTLPFVGTLFTRSGAVGGSRGNVRALLERGELLLIFPEGTPGILKPFAKRYQLQNFRVGHAELAIRYGCPVIPIGVVGAEEQLPQLTTSRRLGRWTGVGEVPIPAVPVPLPVRYHIHYGEPIPLHEQYSPDQADDPQVVKAAANQVRDAVGALLERGLALRKGVFT